MHQVTRVGGSYGQIRRVPGGSEVKASACNAGDLGWIPKSGRSPGEGNGNPLQYSCLENPMDGGAWWATVHRVAKSWTRLSNFTHSLTHSNQGYIIQLLCERELLRDASKPVEVEPVSGDLRSPWEGALPYPASISVLCIKDSCKKDRAGRWLLASYAGGSLTSGRIEACRQLHAHSALRSVCDPELSLSMGDCTVLHVNSALTR